MLVDTSAWIAYFNNSDRFHGQISRFFETELKQSEIVVVETVVNECLAVVRKRLSKTIAVKVAKVFQISKGLEVGYLDKRLHQQTLAMFIEHKARYSYVDCSEYVYAKAYGLKVIVALDNHFKEMGLKVLN